MISFLDYRARLKYWAPCAPSPLPWTARRHTSWPGTGRRHPVAADAGAG